MSVAKLNVEIGARIAELQKGLRQAERELRRSGNNFARIGGDLTTSLSAPLGLLGTAAITAAGDIESLTLALKSQLGSSEAAAQELQKLTEAAKNPGLGVEQAVRGSVRLQGVGLAAEEARQVLVQMGNAIAATGGTAQELDSVTRQFAQMISKGRVLQEDVSILSENMPGLAQMMQKAFGTQSVENIRAMGVSGKEFVMRITEAAKELPRVEGGIKNSIGNAVDALKQSAAKLGFALNEAFDITGTIENVTNAVLGLVNWFAGLEDSTQSFVLGLGAVMVAAGPVVRIFGNMSQLASLVMGGLSNLAGGLRAVMGMAINVRNAILAMNAAMQAFLLVGFAAAVFAIADQMGAFNKELTNAEKAQIAVNDITKEASAGLEGERAKVGALVAVLNDNTKSLGQKQDALKQLQQISPKYFGDLDIEKGKVAGVTQAMAAYIKSLEKAAIVKQATDEIARLSTELTKVQENSDPTAIQYLTNAVKTLALGGLATASGSFQKFNENTRAFNEIDIREATNQKIEALRKLVAENIELSDTTSQSVKATNDQTNALNNSGEAAKKQATLLREVLSDIQVEKDLQALTGAFDLEEVLKKTSKGIERLLDGGFSRTSTAVQNLVKDYETLKSTIESFNPKASTDSIPSLPIPTSVQSQSASPGLPNAPIPTTERALTSAEEVAAKISELTTGLQDGVLRFGDVFSQISDIVTSNGTVMQNVFLGMGEAISQAASEGATSFAQLGKAAAGAAAKIIRAYIQQGVAAAVAKALSSVPFPFNLAAGAAAGGIAAALFTNLIGKIGIKAFAAGTRDAPGGLALVGERGPELVNLPKHSQVFSAGQTHTMMNNRQAVEVFGEFRVKGTDLVLVLEREKVKQQRFR